MSQGHTFADDSARNHSVFGNGSACRVDKHEQKSGNFFLVGVLQFPRDSQGCRGALREPKVIPDQAFGVQAVNAKDLVQMVYQTTK